MITTRKGSKKGTLYLVRSRPKRYETVEERKLLWICLHTDSMTAARTKAEIVWQELIEAWEAKLAGDTEDGEKRLEAAKRLAESRSLRFMRAQEVAALPLREIVDRAKMTRRAGGQPDRIEARAVLGGVEEPSITVSRALDLFWGYARDQTLGMSKDQLRRWENPHKKAIKNFVDVIGDKALGEITGDDMLDFRAWWLDRIAAGEVGTNSATKDLVHLRKVLRTVVQMKRLKIVLPLDGLMIKESEQQQRPAFSVEWIRDKLLAPGALDGLNLEARVILLAMVETGARPSEIANLTASRIRLDHAVPHIEIAPEDRRVKTANAKRVIPLVGVSLEAMRQCPEGFPRYRDSPTLSTTTNKYLRENGLLETPRHTAYSLRHSFETRMIAAEIDDRIKRDLFGHRLDRERYGPGASLEHVQRLLQAMAF